MYLYNIVLTPTSDKSYLLTKLANDYLGDYAYDYLLKDNCVFPHITLCAFTSLNKLEKLKYIQIIKDIKVLVNRNISVELDGLYMGYRNKNDDIYYMCGISVNKKEDICNLHNEVCDLISMDSELGIKTKLRRDKYRPHITLASIKTKTGDFPQFKIKDEFWIEMSDGWSIEVGNSDNLGQYLGSVY